MSLIVRLPSEVMGEVLSQWLDWKSFTRLDSAVCHADIRPALHDLLASEHFTYSCSSVALDMCSADWLYKRHIKVSKVVLGIIRPITKLVSKYMQTYSSSIQSVNCKSEAALTTSAFYCHNVKSMTCNSYVTVNENLDAFLWSNRNLQELFLHGVNGLRASHFEGLSLPQLRIISLRTSNVDDSCLSAIVRTSDHVQVVDLFDARKCTEAGVLMVAQRCPLLFSFGTGALSVSDGTFAQLTVLCPHLTHIDISHNNTVTDHGVRAIAENLSALTSINIAHCGLVTDISLLHLTKHRASTLTALHMQYLKLVRVGVLLHMLQHCTHLDSFSFSFDINGLHQAIVPHLCRLTRILAYSELHEGTISCIAIHCTKLQKFGSFRCTVVSTPSAVGSVPIHSYYSAELRAAGIHDLRVLPLTTAAPQVFHEIDAMPTAGLLALLDSLPHLKCLGMNELPSELAVKLLQRLRPSLHLTDKIQDFTGFQD